jgi:hypothetical protein
MALCLRKFQWTCFFFLEEKGFTGQGHAETNLD